MTGMQASTNGAGWREAQAGRRAAPGGVGGRRRRLLRPGYAWVAMIAGAWALRASGPTRAVAAIPCGPDACTEARVRGLSTTNFLRHYVQAADFGATPDAPTRDRVRQALSAMASLILNGCTNAAQAQQAAAVGEKLIAEGVDSARLYLGVGEMHLLLDNRDEGVRLIEEADRRFRAMPAPPARLLLFAAAELSQLSDPGPALQRNWPAWRDKALDAVAQACADDTFRGEEKRYLYEVLLRFLDNLLQDRRTQLLEAMRRQTGADPYALLLVEGVTENHNAFASRGAKYASAVSEKQWQGFGDHLTLARKALVKAWELAPQYPYAPARMIQVAHCDGVDPNGARLWFDRAVAAQCDCRDAYDYYFWSLKPQWGGTPERVHAFGLECLRTGRYDTLVPYRYFSAVEAEARFVGRLPALLARPDVYSNMAAMCKGYLARRTLPGQYETQRYYYATLAWLHGDYASAARYFEPGDTIESLVACGVPGFPAYLPVGESRIYTGPHGARYGRGCAALAAGRYDEADACWEALRQALARDAAARDALDARQHETRLRRDYDAGQWSDILPPHDMINWLSPKGELAWRQGSNRIVKATVPYGSGAVVYSNLPLKGDFEVLGVLDLRENPSDGVGCGVVIYPLPDSSFAPDEGFVSMVMYPSRQASSIAFGHGAMQQTDYHAGKLQRFHLRVAGNRYSLAVNGQTTLYNRTYPTGVRDGHPLYVGVGMYNGFRGTTARVAFRELKVRRLRAEAPAHRDGFFQGVYTGLNPHWTSAVHFETDGKFHRDGGDGGTYELANGQLTLNWSKWPKEVLKLDKVGVFVRQPNPDFRLHPSITEGDPQ